MDLDETIRNAFGALEAQSTTRDYFDELPGRIEARMVRTTAEETSMDAVPQNEENSGLHDIKALAQTQRQRISRRQTSQHDIDDAFLSSSQSGLRAIALPDPAKIVSLPSPEEARAMAMAADAPSRGAIEARTSSRKVPSWMLAGGGLAAAAAAVLAFVAFGGKGSDEPKRESAAQAKAATTGSAMGAASAEAPKAVPVPAPTIEPITTNGIATASDVGQGMGSGTAEPAANVAEAAATATVVPRDEAKKDSHGASSHEKPSGGAGGSTSKGGDSGSKPDQEQATGTDKASGTTTTVKKDTLDGAVLGKGDKDELGIGDVMDSGEKHHDTGPTNTELSDKDTRAGLHAIEGKAKSCYDKYQVAGTAKVKLTIDPSGKVTKASATGDFAGTPTGDCVAAAVKSATFPPWTGGPTSTMFVVLLSD